MIFSRDEINAALIDRHGTELFHKFSSATVALCGLGGLGSCIATALARAGIGKLILIDFDRVDITNLHRQQYKASQIGMKKTAALAANLREFAPYIELETHTVKIDKSNVISLLGSADVICEAFDNPYAKAMLTDTVLENLHDKFLVAASGMAGMGDANSILTRKITDRFYLCGDGVSDVSDGVGLVASRVMLCAAHQAHTVLRILSEK